eukprot:scaffold51870_cov71-Cyclotella_meneghiniana.AAC.2
MLRIFAAQTVKPRLSLLCPRITKTQVRSVENITMIDQYDSIEKEFGIAAYASPHQGFAAVVKARYSDFIVHEG